MSFDLLSLKEVIERTGLSRRTLFRYRENGKFPSHIHLGPRFIAWPTYAIDDWCKKHPPAPKRHRD